MEVVMGQVEQLTGAFIANQSAVVSNANPEQWAALVDLHATLGLLLESDDSECVGDMQMWLDLPVEE